MYQLHLSSFCNPCFPNLPDLHDHNNGLPFSDPHFDVSALWKEMKEVYLQVDGFAELTEEIYSQVDGFAELLEEIGHHVDGFVELTKRNLPPGRGLRTLTARSLAGLSRNSSLLFVFSLAFQIAFQQRRREQGGRERALES